MEDQFRGRTDDDLFADDFEPVPESTEPPSVTGPKEDEQQEPRRATVNTNKTDTHRSQPRQRPNPLPRASPPAPAPTTAAPASSSVPSAPRSLAQSRHNYNKPAQSSKPQRQATAQNTGINIVEAASTKSSAGIDVAGGSAGNVSQAAPSTPAASANTSGFQNGSGADKPEKLDKQDKLEKSERQDKPEKSEKPDKPDPLVRLQSGANPRTKLTDEELTAKMQQMRILSAEKTRRFEQAQRDETDHAIAYARGMEEARKRRALEEEKRRRGEEERRRMDDERAKNRERKLAAMGQKEGGWDEGKDPLDQPEDRRAHKRADNPGLRDLRSGTGLAGSRFASASGLEQQLDERRDGRSDRGNRGRGRGRGGSTRGGRGRGGNQFDGDRAGGNRAEGHPQTGNNGPASAALQPLPLADEFPALPKSDSKKAQQPTRISTGSGLGPMQPMTPLSPPIGGWDDEMAAIDASGKA